MKSIYNARIKSTSLGTEDHGILTFYLHLEWNGGGCGFGGYALDEYDKAMDKRIATARGLQCIQEVMRVVGVSSWESLAGKYIRVEQDDSEYTIHKIGNLMEDNWIDLKTFWKSDKEG
jgi:hypothetical protein